jgi:hypothetical protein
MAVYSPANVWKSFAMSALVECSDKFHNGILAAVGCSDAFAWKSFAKRALDKCVADVGHSATSETMHTTENLFFLKVITMVLFILFVDKLWKQQQVKVEEGSKSSGWAPSFHCH